MLMLDSAIPGMTPRRGKVRDVYDFGDRLLFVATDRISAFDYVLPNAIPRKGEVLTRLSQFWFDLLGVPHHFISDDPQQLPLPAGTDVTSLRGRSMVVRRTDVIPIECVARGYLSGSGWKEYQQSGTVCGIPLPAGLQESSRLPAPIFTPATKAETGHDENISFERTSELIGQALAEQLRELTLSIYQRGCQHAAAKGIIIADTKFEFGIRDGQVILIDEVMTPDSSRFWPADLWQPGRGQASFDKQFVRDWLLSSGWDRNSPPPQLPDDVVQRTSARYIEAWQRLTGLPF
ncbi:MAG TPA: phosphoribosylaminoimidazolesuccinocarboxamide synthase [Planctomycetaceae bacterium]|nr:phosphoribosylaminoimidazolesuccinocarboxamide synthase [Planctomycetaceae bacterium]HBC64250.1 phosphoribosylaminoimidazolesuccinocarboxamide synthase [Planctomycetaceae bacterium]